MTRETDIVERLREEASTWDDPLLKDAADEIEKRTGGRDKSSTVIIETCLKTRGALGRK